MTGPPDTGRSGVEDVRSFGSRSIVTCIAWMLVLASSTSPAPGLEAIDVAPVWSGHPVGFSLETEQGFQYVAFYDPQRQMTVGQRRLGSSEWRFTTLPSRVKWDSHNSIVLAVDCQGYIHVSGNMHGSRLVYFRSLGAHDISRFEQPRMVGSLERKVTYPQFLKGGDSCLYFQYRHGKSGDGVRILNRYDPVTQSWSRLLSKPLFDGEGRMSAYLSGPVVGPDGYFHLVWMWRDSPLGSTNHDISYARSLDLAHWENVEGEPLSLPFRPGTSRAVVDPVRSGEGLVAIAFGVGWDRDGRPVVGYSKYGLEGYSQWFNARWEDGVWQQYQTSSWTFRWDLERTGALPWDIAVAPVGVDREGRLTQFFDHLQAGRGTWILDERTLKPIGVLPEAEYYSDLRVVESDVESMEVREFVFDRRGEYFLRWETLPINRDKPREPPFPPPSMLRVYRIPGEVEAEEADVVGGDTALGTASPDMVGSGGAGSVAIDEAVRSAGEDDATEVDGEYLERNGALIGEVEIRIADVFDERDPTENRRLFRWVNRLHPRTREWVIREQLFFGPGDSYSARILEESERHLRTKSYLYDADIRPLRYRDGVVDVLVETRDVWTLTGGVSFNRAGGENDIEFKVNDSNFLGFGRKVGLSHSNDFERTSTELTFLDTNLLGGRGQMEVKLAENSDGFRRLLHLRRPFFELDARRARGMTVLLEDRVDFVFDGGEVTSKFQHTIDFFEAYWGLSSGLKEGSVARWKLGYTYSDDSFFAVPGQPQDAPVPPDRKLAYPWIDFQFIQDRWVEAKDLNRIARTEDINLGATVQARVGWSAPTFGADETLAVSGFTAATGFRPNPRTLIFAALNGGARYGDGEFKTIVLGGDTRLHWRNFGRHAFFARLEANYVEDLDPEKQLLLGGDTGLRGYPLGYQSGDRRFLLTLEQRFFTDRELFKLGHLGGAVFFDAGRAWFENAEDDPGSGVLTDIGLGLRLSSSRSSGKSVLHIDVAFPLDGDDSIDDVQFVVKTRESF